MVVIDTFYHLFIYLFIYLQYACVLFSLVMPHPESGSVETEITNCFTDANNQSRQYFEDFPLKSKKVARVGLFR